MISLLLIAWLSLPLAPLNPIEQDTIAAMNFHLSAGITSPNGIVSAGPELSLKYEWRPAHPLVLRTELDFRLGSIGSRFFPGGSYRPSVYLTGNYQSMLTGLDLLYYRGTDRMTAYLGFGLVYAFNRFTPGEESLQELHDEYGIDDLDMAQKLGYRVTLGLRFHRNYSFELAVTQLKPDIVAGRDYGNGVYSKQNFPTQFSGFRFTLGYIWQLRQW